MKYEDIHGWFDWATVYQQCLQQAPRDAQMVEVGVWMGKSLSYLAELCQRTNRQDVTLYGVDHWYGCEKCQDEIVQALEGDEDEIYRIARANLDYPNVRLLRMDANDAAHEFRDGSLDLVFIDADHKYGAVKKNILSWLPKVKVGGLIAGHDIISWPSVKKAVQEVLPQYNRLDNCWIWRKS